MAHITATQVQAWLESTKLTVTTIDPSLETQVSTEILGKLAQTLSAYTPLWVDTSTTPEVVQQCIAMTYAGWIFDRAYSEVVSQSTTASYGAQLRAWAMTLLNDIITGGVFINEIAPNSAAAEPAYYPNDASSTSDALANNTDVDDNSLGPAMFGVSKVF